MNFKISLKWRIFVHSLNITHYSRDLGKCGIFGGWSRLGAGRVDDEAETREGAAEQLAVIGALQDGGGEFLLGIEVESVALELVGDFLELEKDRVVQLVDLVKEGLPVKSGRVGCGGRCQVGVGGGR